MKQLICILLVLYIFSISFMYGEEEIDTGDFDELFEELDEDIADNPDPDEKTDTDFSIHIKSEHTAALHMPVIEDYFTFDGPVKSPGLENIFSLTVIQQDLVLHSNWQLTLSPAGTGEWQDLVDPKTLENYILWSPKGFSLGLGYQIITWGVSDKMNPTDNINPKDYTKITEVTSIPELALHLKWYPVSSLAIEGVYVPLAGTDIFPVHAEDRIPAILFAPEEVTVEKLPADIWSCSLGTKLSFYSGLADISLSYLFDYDSYFTPSISFNSPVDKHLTLARKPIHRIGADVKTTIGPLGVWLESCLSLTEDNEMEDDSIRNPNLTWTFGFDFNFGPSGEFYANFQYGGRYIFDYYADFFTDYPGGMPDPAQMIDPDYATTYYYRLLTQNLAGETEGLLNTVSVNLEFPLFDNKVIPNIRAAYLLPLIYDTEEKTRYGSLIASPTLILKPADSFEIIIGTDLMFAWYSYPDSKDLEIDWNDPVGMFHDDSNVFLKINYVWGYDF